MRTTPRLWLFLFTLSVSFSVYLFTLSPTVGLEDSGEFITAIHSLGIAHPSGYPLYVVLGKLFTLAIPLGDIAWRVNLFSAFCASVAVGLFTLFLIDVLFSLFPSHPTIIPDNNLGIQIKKINNCAAQKNIASHRGGKTYWSSFLHARISSLDTKTWFALNGIREKNLCITYLIAVSTSLAFAFSSVFWSQAVIAEVYTLNALLVITTLYLLWQYWLHRYTRTLYLAAFVYGLSINNHQMMMLLAPVYFLFFFAAEFKSRTTCTKSLPKFFIAFLLFTLGLSFYLFVLLRAGQDPLLNWDHPETLDLLWRHFTRQAYGDISTSVWGELWHLKKVIYVYYFFIDLLHQLTPIGALLAFVGFLTAWFRTRPLFLLSFGVFLMNSLVIIFLRKVGYQYEGEQIYRMYYIPAYLITFLWAGMGVKEIVEYLRAKHFFSHDDTALHLLLPAVMGFLLLATFPVFLLIYNFNTNDKSNFWIARDWGISVLTSIAPNAVLLLHNEQPAADSQIFIITYLTLVENMRPDIAVVDAGYLSSRFYHPKGPDIEEISKLPPHQFRTRLLNRVWKLARIAGRPVYTVYPTGSALNGDLIGRSNGLAFRIFPNTETARISFLPPAALALRITKDAWITDNAYYRDFISDIHYAHAAYLLEQGHFKASETEFINGFNLDVTPLSANAYDYMAYRARWRQAIH